MKTILLIDDDVNLLHAYSLMLKKQGYRTLKASSGHEGLKLALTENVDMVISDIYMPKKNGLIVIKQIRRILKYRDIPIIVLSAGGTKQNVYRGIELGVNAFLTKPCGKDELCYTVKKLFQSRNNVHKERYRNLKVDSSIWKKSHETSILLVYKNADVTDNLYEFLTEYFYKVNITEDIEITKKILNERKTDVLIMEVNNPYDDNFKFLYNIYSQDRYVEIPVIVISELKNELEEVFDSLHFQVDKIVMKPFEYNKLFSIITQVTDAGYLTKKYVYTYNRIKNKLKDNKYKESCIVNNLRFEIAELERENKKVIKSGTILKKSKFLIVNKNNKSIANITQKISNANQLFLKRRQLLMESKRIIEEKIKSFERKRFLAKV